MKLYEIFDRNSGLGFTKFDNLNGYVPVWKTKPKQYKSYPIVRENLYSLLNQWHVAKAQICQIELKQVLELPYDTPLKPPQGNLNGATIFVLLDKATGKYFCTGRGFDTNLMGAKYFESIEKAKASVQRKVNALKKSLVEGFVPAYTNQIFGGLVQLKDSSSWVIIGLTEKRTWLPQSAATSDSGVEMDWD